MALFFYNRIMIEIKMRSFDKKPQKATRPKTTDRERFEIALDPIADKDIVEHLNRQPNKSDYVRRLIRKDLDTQ